MKVICNKADESICDKCKHSKPHDPENYYNDGFCNSWETRCPTTGEFVICVEVMKQYEEKTPSTDTKTGVEAISQENPVSTTEKKAETTKNLQSL